MKNIKKSFKTKLFVLLDNIEYVPLDTALETVIAY